MKLESFLVTIFLILACVVLPIIIVITASCTGCVSRGEIMGLEAKYSMVSGCMIEIMEDKWIPLEVYRWQDNNE